MSKNLYNVLLAVIVVSTACNKQIDRIKPQDQINQEGELSTLPGIIQATNGNYLNLNNGAGSPGYVLEQYWANVSEFRGNNVTFQSTSSKPPSWTDAYNYTNTAGDENSGFTKPVWKGYYQMIVSINICLEGIEAFKTNMFSALSADDRNRLLHAEGENYFLRALAYFNLVRLYGMPYYNHPETNAGVMLKTSSDPADIPGRSTVKETYALIIQDLQQATALMNGTGSLSNSFANTGAARALLSRVYLFMGGGFSNTDQPSDQLAITYADSVINDPQYQLQQGQDYVDMFAPDLDGSLGREDPTGDKEIIFAFVHPVNPSDVDAYYRFDPSYASSTSGFFPAKSFLALIAPNDLRNHFLLLNPDNNKVETTKYQVQPNAFLSNAPYIYLRLAEVYLNRAEAEVKTGDDGEALSDLNAIHTRAGLAPLAGLSGQALFDAILRERRIELAFEGHNSFDDFRNALPMVRPSLDTNGDPFIIQPDDPKVVMRLPQSDISTNPKLKQNQQ